VTLGNFKSEIVDGLPMRVAWRNARHVDRVFDLLLANFDATQDIESFAKRMSFEYGRRNNVRAVPWTLVIAVLLELLRWWLSNEGERHTFKKFQAELKSLE
jgi:hypothetical protein